MGDATRFQFTDASVPRAYEELLVPRFFAPLAAILLDAIALRPGESLLDVATGPGTVARLAASRTGGKSRIVGVDLSAPMLEVARSRSQGIEYREAPAQALPFADAELDAVVCQQGLQFFPDRAAALQEMRRVLKPGGRLGVAVWCGLDRCQPFAEIHAVLRGFLPAETADLIQAPFSWPGGKELEATVAAAGFRDVRLSVHTIPHAFEKGLAQAVRTLEASPLAPHILKLPGPRQADLITALARCYEKYLDGAVVRLTMESNLVVARR